MLGAMQQARILAAQSLKKYKEKINWSAVKKVVTLVFFALVAYLIVNQASSIDWPKVWETVKSTKPIQLLYGLLLAFACYAVYASYDLLGRHLLQHQVSVAKTWFAALLSYAFNMNLSSLVGGVAFRYRLYSQLGVKPASVTRILGISIATNWLGYVLLAGILFVSGQVNVPDSWGINSTALRWFGGVFVSVVVAYVLMCWRARKRLYQFRSITLTLPKLHIALVQLLLACTHWTLMAAVIYQFLGAEVTFPTVFAVLLVSSIAGVITHIPGGLGVLEAVFVTLLAGQVDKATVLGGLFAYRCVFYLAPLAVATPLYLLFEAMVKRRAKVLQNTRVVR